MDNYYAQRIQSSLSGYSYFIQRTQNSVAWISFWVFLAMIALWAIWSRMGYMLLEQKQANQIAIRQGPQQWQGPIKKEVTADVD
jgi:hypothetical protein